MTTGMKNIEAVFSKAGATATHTPGYATQRQTETENAPSSSSADNSEKKNATSEGEFVGVGTTKHEERFADQVAEPSALGKMWYTAMTGSEKGPQGRSSWQA